MSFLEITKIHLARQEETRSASAALTLDGHLMRRIIWKSENAIVFQDPDGHFWRYLCSFRRSERALIKPKSN
jgi:hypothetical protein